MHEMLSFHVSYTFRTGWDGYFCLTRAAVHPSCSVPSIGGHTYPCCHLAGHIFLGWMSFPRMYGYFGGAGVWASTDPGKTVLLQRQCQTAPEHS